jgi:hypothetical protein
MRCKHDEWDRVSGTQGNRVQCKKCGTLGYRRAWGGFKNGSRQVIRYRCPCGRLARKRVWRGTHELFLCLPCAQVREEAERGGDAA